MLRILLTSLSIILLDSQWLRAQGAAPIPPDEAPSGRRIVPFLEGSDLLKDDRYRETIFEARIAPHLILWQNFDDVITLDGGPGGAQRRSYGFSLSVTPAVLLRMYKEVSNPVKTPSYMPRLNFQTLWAPGIRRAAAGTSGIVHLTEMHWSVGHHSNGQKGCFYAEQFRDEIDCRLREDTPFTIAPVTVDSQGRQRRPEGDKIYQTTINKEDGSFSTNYVRTGVNWRRNVIDGSMKTAVRALTFGVDIQVHFLTDGNMLGTYPTARASVRAEYLMRGSSRHGWLCGSRQDFRVESTALLENRPTTVWPASLSLQATCYPKIPGAQWGIFARFYQGEDYYNLGYFDNIRRLQIGLTFGQDGFFRFQPGS